MKTSTIGFILPNLGISGGIHIVLRWAELLARKGYLVHVLVPRARRLDPLPFLDEEETPFSVIAMEDAGDIPFDLVFATWWETLPRLREVRTRRVALLLQGLESQGYPYGSEEQAQFEALVTSGLPIVTIAHWLASYLVESLGIPAQLVQTVLNPLDPELWRPVPPRVPKGARLRFLVEGHADVALKNVRETLSLLERVGAEHLWVGSRVDRSLTGRHCIGVLESVPYREMPSVYASCDVLVKLSNAEGMFGPPLEMFATGGTAIAWDVPGSEEYLSHRYNCLLAPMNSLPAVQRAIAELERSPPLVRELQRNARRTAEAWPDWNDQTPRIIETVEGVPETSRAGLLRAIEAYRAWRSTRAQPIEPARPGTHRVARAGLQSEAPPKKGPVSVLRERLRARRGR